MKKINNLLLTTKNLAMTGLFAFFVNIALNSTTRCLEPLWWEETEIDIDINEAKKLKGENKILMKKIFLKD